MRTVLVNRWLVCLLYGLTACSQPSETTPPESTEGTPEQAIPQTSSAITEKQPDTQALGTRVRTENGAYSVALEPQNGPVRIGERQPWVARVTDNSGAVFAPNALYFDGGMPGHGHGLPSAPEFTRHLGGSDYLLEGMLLNMPGDWRFVVTVGGPAGVDSAVFNYNIQPGQLSRRQDSETVDNWSNNELALINSLRLNGLGTPNDASNRFVHNSIAIELGRDLFNDVSLSATGEVSCATCHQPERGFADGKRLGFGSAPTKRHTPALSGVAHANWFYWDGRRDSLWSQAITPLETPGEMDNTRTMVVRYAFSAPHYRKRLVALLGTLPDFSDTDRFPEAASPFGNGKLSWHRMTEADRRLVNDAFATVGKLIAAYETTLQHRPGKFDRWAQALLGDEASKDNTPSTKNVSLTAAEQAGLHLFLDLPRTQCLRCHNGPLFSNQGFHNVATAEPAAGTKGTHDFGRMLGLQSVLVDPFNCSGSYSDADTDDCEHLRFARRQNLGETIDGAFKVPSLRNLVATAPYFHDGRFATLQLAVDHYRNQLGGNRLRISEVPDIELTDTERDQLVAFLKTL